MRKRVIYLIFFLFTVLTGSLFADQAALVLENITLPDEQASEKVRTQIREKMKEELERQNLQYLDQSSVALVMDAGSITADQFGDREIILQLGRSASVPVVLVVSVQERNSLMEVHITAWDINGEKEITSERNVSKSEVTQYIMINSSISKVVRKLTDEYGVDIVQKEPKVRKITFLSNQDGMKVYMANGDFLGEIDNSVLTITGVEYDIGTKLLIIKELDGYRPGEQYIFLDKEKSAVPLSDLVKAQNMALEFNWTYTQLMGVGTGFRFYPIPDWLYISFDSYFYLQEDFSTPSGLEMTHSDMRLLAGLYLGFGPENLFRISASLGLGFILSYPLNSDNLYFDTYINALNLALELNFDKWSLYLRPELRIALNIGNSSIYKGGIILNEWSIPHITLGVIRKW